MDDKSGFVITNRDRVLRAWENSTELVRNYQEYSHEMEDDKKLAEIFAEYAEDEALHAVKLLKLLQSYEK
ncbi:MAG: ferritin family protein [Oscillospiraceae bacterium]|nr:ferritin family protein [Oscillospiraceae bacterium]